MHCVNLVAGCLPAKLLPEISYEGICCVTGEECETIARKHGILPSFTNLDFLRAPMSDRIGINAWLCLTYTTQNPGKKRGLRPLQQSSWLCDGEKLYMLDRPGIRAHVLDGVSASKWAGYATTSYKKHGVLRAPINSMDRQIWCWETILVDCSDNGKVKDIWYRMRDAQDNGIHRPLIETLDISSGYINKIGWKKWGEFESWARPRMYSALYRFITYLLPSMKELKCEL